MDVIEFNEESPLKVGRWVETEYPANGSVPITTDEQDPGSGSAAWTGSGSQRSSRLAGSASRGQFNGHGLPQQTGRFNTSHFKHVPESSSIRELIHAAAQDVAATLSKTWPVDAGELETLARELLDRVEQPDRYLGFTMVLIGNAFWREQLLATPFQRRLLLLPGEFDHAAGCGGERALTAGISESCWACFVLQLQHVARELGYRVILADRSSTVLHTLVEDPIDAIVGIADMNHLERAVEHVLLAGVPSFVVPLGADFESRSGADLEFLLNGESLGDVLERHVPRTGPLTRSYLPVMRAANRLFTDEFERLLPRRRSAGSASAAAALGRTEDIAHDWLANGGKRFRPFITLAAYDALVNQEAACGRADSLATGGFPDSVCRVAMAIEAFHKASLVHDDIQDDDQFRYGRETLHRSQGVGPAINIGDYLIGLGYRLVNSCHDDLGAGVAADIVDSMADAHLKLCDGQGAEMAWQVDPDWSLTPADALHIYALKTSPAFEAALYAGLRMAGPVDDYAAVIPAFARQIGVGFQVLNDLKDWQGDIDNKLVVGQDALAVRPTMLLALALDAASNSQQSQLRNIYQSQDDDAIRLRRLLELFSELHAFDAAINLVDRARQQALNLAAGVEPLGVRRLLTFLVHTVLAATDRAVSSADGMRYVPSAKGNGSGSSKNGKTLSGLPGSKSLR